MRPTMPCRPTSSLRTATRVARSVPAGQLARGGGAAGRQARGAPAGPGGIRPERAFTPLAGQPRTPRAAPIWGGSGARLVLARVEPVFAQPAKADARAWPARIALVPVPRG